MNLISDYYLSCFPQATTESLIIEPLTGGLSNSLYQCKTEDGSSPQAVVRMYGSSMSLFIDREREVEFSRVLSTFGCGKRIYGSFPLGRVEEYVEGDTLMTPMLSQTPYMEANARELARFHSIPQEPFQNEPLIWEVLGKWIHMARTLLPCYEETYGRIEAYCVSMKETRAHDRIVFGHNDLLAGNILYDRETKQSRFLDMEYSSRSPRAFDLANHFCEWTGFETDWSLFPSEHQQYTFCKLYLSCTSKHVNDVNDASEMSDADVRSFMKEVNEYVPLSNAYWGVWALIKYAKESKDEMEEFARKRLARSSFLSI